MSQQPFWAFLPFINNRTAWKPVSFPAVLIIPFGSDSSGNPLSKSAPKDVTVSILDVVRRNKVAGHQYKDVFFPDRELYTLTISGVELSSKLLDLNDFVVDGDYVTIINRSGLSGKLPYIPDSLYYDFSDVLISVDNLAIGRYQLSFRASVNHRVYDSSGGLVCIDDSKDDLIIINTDINHPGEVLNEMVNTTPSVWFSNGSLDKEPLIDLYKPLSDCLQNVFDEQILLSKINFISNAYPETIQALGQTIGWEIPYFPQSLDLLRKSVLRTTTSFQKGRGAFNSIHQLFDLFGYNILIRNLWFSPDNSELVEPKYDLFAPVQYVDKLVLDVGVGGLVAPGFYSAKVPLICKPGQKTRFDNFTDVGSDVYVESYAVKVGSDADLAIREFLAGGDYDDLVVTSNGVVNNDLNSRMIGLDVYASHQVKINTVGNKELVYKTGSRDILFLDGISVNKYDPSVTVQLSGHWNDPDVAVYVFIVYKTQQVVIGDADWADKRSNYFDIRVNSREDTLSPTSLVLDYALEFLYRIKAFHSLIRNIFLEYDSSEVYLVGDYCYGPGLSVSNDSDAGLQQVPPAIKPIDSDNKCDEQDARLLGYKDSDIQYRNRVTAGLIEEWESYLTYDNRSNAGGILGMLPQVPNPSRSSALYNEFGQDAFIGSYDVLFIYGLKAPFVLANQSTYTKTLFLYEYDNGSEVADNRSVSFRSVGYLAGDDGYVGVEDLNSRDPICFKGRVSDDLYLNYSLPHNDNFIISPCTIHLGSGSAFTTPRRSIIVQGGAVNRSIGSKSGKPVISANQAVSGIDFDFNGLMKFDSVGIDPSRLIGDSDEVLHYWDRTTTVDSSWNSVAVDIPDFNIQVTNLHFPGTRFISLGKLNGTVVNNSVKHRPWDFDDCESNLNPVMVIGSDNNEYLVFDDLNYSVSNNTGEPDLPHLGLPSISSLDNSSVVHAIYSKYADGNTPGLCPYDSGVDENGVGNVNSALFKSAVDCDTGGVRDFVDGYPCVTGLLNLTINTDSVYDLNPVGDINADFLFLFMSGVLDGSLGFRLDCDCVKASCNVTSNTNACVIDAQPDDVVMDDFMVLAEEIGGDTWYFDGEVPSFFELND